MWVAGKKEKESIAELVAALPMLMGTLLEGSRLKTEPGLNISEKRTLMYIYRHEGGTMTDYSKRVGLARGSFTTVADSLEQKGLVSRAPGTGDRRSYTLVLTEEGKSAAQEIDSRFKQFIFSRLETLTENELHSLNKALETIDVVLDKIKAERASR